MEWKRPIQNMRIACNFALRFNFPSDDDDRHFDFAVIFTRKKFGYSGMCQSCPAHQKFPLKFLPTLKDKFRRNHRELATLPTLSEILAEGGVEPLTIGSVGKNLTTELSSELPYPNDL